MKIQRYMSEHGISAATLAEVAAKAFRNGALNPNAWRRRPLTAQEILASKMVNHPLTQFMFCSPGEGATALVLARGARLRGSFRPPVPLRSVAAHPVVRLLRGLQPVDCARVRSLTDGGGRRGRG
jgi:acetyl-CoA C-acetyltransferase